MNGAVEGDLDEVLLRRIVEYAGLSLGNVYGRKGKPSLLQSINGYNKAARFDSWIVLIDLDCDCECAPACLQQWLPNPSQHMSFRIAVRSIETWLLADRERIAQLLGIGLANIPPNPDSLDNPKQEFMNLARRSNRQIKNDLVPREGSGRSVGALYNARMIKFIQDEEAGWRPSHAVLVSDSFARCVTRLQEIAELV